MIPVYNLVDDTTEEVIAYAYEIMTDKQIDLCNQMINDHSLMADTNLYLKPVLSLVSICF